MNYSVVRLPNGKIFVHIDAGGGRWFTKTFVNRDAFNKFLGRVNGR